MYEHVQQGFHISLIYIHVINSYQLKTALGVSNLKSVCMSSLWDSSGEWSSWYYCFIRHILVIIFKLTTIYCMERLCVMFPVVVYIEYIDAQSLWIGSCANFCHPKAANAESKSTQLYDRKWPGRQLSNDKSAPDATRMFFPSLEAVFSAFLDSCVTVGGSTFWTVHFIDHGWNTW